MSTKKAQQKKYSENLKTYYSGLRNSSGDSELSLLDIEGVLRMVENLPTPEKEIAFVKCVFQLKYDQLRAAA